MPLDKSCDTLALDFLSAPVTPNVTSLVLVVEDLRGRSFDGPKNSSYSMKSVWASMLERSSGLFLFLDVAVGLLLENMLPKSIVQASNILLDQADHVATSERRTGGG